MLLDSEMKSKSKSHTISTIPLLVHTPFHCHNCKNFRNGIGSSDPLTPHVQEKAAFIFCVEDRALFCRDCDQPIHSAGTLSANHQRFLATGIHVALSSNCNTKTEIHGLEPPAQQQQSNLTSSWVADDLLQFPDIESSNKKEHLELEWLAADTGLFSDQLPQEALTTAEVPRLTIPQSNNFTSYKAPRHSMAHRKPRSEIQDDDDDHDDELSTVPDLGRVLM